MVQYFIFLCIFITLPVPALFDKSRAEEARQHLLLQVNLVLELFTLIKSICSLKKGATFADSFSSCVETPEGSWSKFSSPKLEFEEFNIRK